MAELKTTVVELITRKHVLEVTASDLLRLLMRCKEIPRRSEGHYEVREGGVEDGGAALDLGDEAAMGGDVVATVTWTQELKPSLDTALLAELERKTFERWTEHQATKEEGAALDTALDEAQAAVDALPEGEPS